MKREILVAPKMRVTSGIRVGSPAAHDNPEAPKVRLVAYREQTAPVSAYYASRGVLKTVDGIAPIAEVTKALDAMLG